MAAKSSRSCRQYYTRPRVSVSKIIGETLPSGLWGLRQASPPVGDRPFAWGPGAEGDRHTYLSRYTYRHIDGFPISVWKREVYMCHVLSHHTYHTCHVRMTCEAHMHMPWTFPTPGIRDVYTCTMHTMHLNAMYWYIYNTTPTRLHAYISIYIYI